MHRVLAGFFAFFVVIFPWLNIVNKYRFADPGRKTIHAYQEESHEESLSQVQTGSGSHTAQCFIARLGLFILLAPRLLV